MTTPGSAWDLRDRLSDLGVIREASPGRWELGIPGFGDTVLREMRD